MLHILYYDPCPAIFIHSVRTGTNPFTVIRTNEHMIARPIDQPEELQ